MEPTSQRNCRAFRNCQGKRLGIHLASEIRCSVRRAVSWHRRCRCSSSIDLDGSEATETVTFGLDGASYEIDLSSGNAGKLRKELAHYVEHARKASSQARRRRAVLARAASAVPKSGHGPSSAVTRSMSAGVFRQHRRGVRGRALVRAPEFAVYSGLHEGSVVSADRPRHFCDGGGAGRIASLVPRGRGFRVLSPRSRQSPGWTA